MNQAELKAKLPVNPTVNEVVLLLGLTHKKSREKAVETWVVSYKVVQGGFIGIFLNRINFIHSFRITKIVENLRYFSPI